MVERLNIHIYPSPLTHESRILRITDALNKAAVFDRFDIIGLAADGLPAVQEVDEHRRFLRYPRKLFKQNNSLLAKAVKTVEWSLRVLANMHGRKVACVNAHSLAVLPLSYLVSRLTGARLVYDTHELETEASGLKGMHQNLGRVVEQIFIKRCDAVFVVSDSIADWYVDHYGIERPTVVRNIPQFAVPITLAQDRAHLRQRLGIGENELVYIYQGGFMQGRGLERLIRVFERVSLNRHLLCMGSGLLTNLVAEAAARQSNIHLLPAVQPDEVLRYTCAADIGICLTANSCLSYFYSLPNKLFEYMHAGLPIIVTPLVEQERIVNTHQCGWVAPVDDNELRDLLNNIDNASVARHSPASAVREFNWSTEALRLVQRYKSANLAN